MAVLFASIRPYNQWLIERKVAARIYELNGTVTWKGFTKWNAEWRWPTIASVNLSNKNVSKDDLEGIGFLSKLNFLTLDRTQVSAAGLAHLCNLQQLHTISLVGTPTTDEGLKSLSTLANLEELTLLQCQVTDEGMSLVAGMPRLSLLWIDGTVATDAGVGHLKSLPNLKSLAIVGKPTVSDEMLLELRDQVAVLWIQANGGKKVRTILLKSPLRKKQQKNSGPQDTSS